MRFRLRAFAVAGLVAAGSITVVTVTTPAHADSVICDQYGSTGIQGRYIVGNNRWGTGDQQCVTVTSTGFTLSTSNANKPTNGAPASYPSVYYGCHYNNCTPGTILPLQTSDSRFERIRTGVNMSYPSGGSWNASYDLWFDPTARRDGQNTGAELMIWLNHQGPPQPIGSRVGSATIEGATWDVWFGNIGWNVISYVRTTGTTSASFAPSAFYTDVVKRGYGQRSWYLTSIQAGFEPWLGGTGLAVRSFSVTTDGSAGGGSGGGAGGGSGSGSGGGGTSPTASTRASASAPASPSAPPPGGDASCRATYTASSWGTGFVGNVAITNTGTAPVDGWTVTWNWAGNQRITNAWNAATAAAGSTASASVAARNVDYNPTIAPGGTTSFGFQGTYSGNNAAPTSFALNGRPCAM